jgi:hypothetical protein
MILLQGLWHACKVLSAAMFWLMTIALVWAGFALMGQDARWGWADLAAAIGIFAGRGLMTPRFVPAGASYVIAFGTQVAFLIFAAIITRYGVS